MKKVLLSVVCLVGAVLSNPAHAGLDVYSGPLSKFYKNDYLSTQALAAQEIGAEFSTFYPDDEPEWLTDKNAARKIDAFKKKIRTHNKLGVIDLSSWNEKFDEHFIEQLTWDGLSALIHVTAYAIRNDLDRPLEFSGDYQDYEAYLEASDKGYYLGPIAILEADVFLPSDSKTMFIEDNPLKEEVLVTSTANLRMTLEYINRRVWGGKADPDLWFERKLVNESTSALVISDETGKPEMMEVEPDRVEDVALHNAGYAYAVLVKALEYSDKHNLPIMMDR